MVHTSLRCRGPSSQLKLALMNIYGICRVTYVANTYLSRIDNAPRLFIDVVDAEPTDSDIKAFSWTVNEHKSQ